MASVNPVAQKPSLLSEGVQILQAIGLAKSIFSGDPEKLKELDNAERRIKMAEQAQAQDFSEKFEQVPSDQAIPGLKAPQGLSIPEDQSKGFALRPPQKDPMEIAAKQFDLLNKELQVKRNRLAIEKSERETTGEGKKPLKPVEIERFGQGRQAVKQLAALEDTLKENEDKLGPVMGRFAKYNEFDVDAQTVQAAVNTAKQTVGKYLEGGVLRKEDEVKYERILPKLSDTPEVAANKLNMVRDLLHQKLKDDLGALSDQGFDITGLEANIENQQMALQPQQQSAPGFNVLPTAQAEEPFNPVKFIGKQ